MNIHIKEIEAKSVAFQFKYSSFCGCLINYVRLQIQLKFLTNNFSIIVIYLQSCRSSFIRD